jgi:hypothetical protein
LLLASFTGWGGSYKIDGEMEQENTVIPAEPGPASAPETAALPVGRIILPAAKHGFMIFLDLAKIVGPIYLAVALLGYTGAMAVLARAVAPVMHIFGLPGEAAVVLLTGWFLTIYAAAGALGALHLPQTAITAVGLMILLCHAIPVEWAVLHKMGARATRITIIRFLLSLVVGFIYALLYRGHMGNGHVTAITIQHTQAFWPFMLTSLLGCLKLLALVLAIVVPITAGSELARAKDVPGKIARRLSGSLWGKGPAEGYVMPLLIGLTFGILYGGGAMIAMTRSGLVKPEEARTAGLFLGLCHSLIDDPLLFVLLGGNLWWLYGVRIVLALALTPALRRWQWA